MSDNQDLLAKLAAHIFPVEAERRAALLEIAAPPQPAPVPGSGPNCHDEAARILLERKAVGLARYGQPLQADNGRDAMRDALEEAADLLPYLVAARMQRDEERADLMTALRKMVDYCFEGDGVPANGVFASVGQILVDRGHMTMDDIGDGRVLFQWVTP